MAGSKNILIVEDDKMIRDMYTSALTNDGYKIAGAGSAKEAYSALKSFKPDYVLLDVMLPETSGLEILNELRKNTKLGCQKAKILIMTNLAEESVKQKSIEGGADGFVIKSDILPKDLAGIIGSLS